MVCSLGKSGILLHKKKGRERGKKRGRGEGRKGGSTGRRKGKKNGGRTQVGRPQAGWLITYY